MASQTLRPHRSPSPSPAPSTPVNPSNPAKLTRQSLGPPPTTSSGAARGFAGLGISGSPGFGSGGSQPRHVSSSVALGLGSTGRDSLSPRPSFGSTTNRAVSGGTGRPSSEFLPGGAPREVKTPEAEQIDQWFKHLASWEVTLEEMAAASTDQNFTEELGAIEQWFRVLSEAERTAALYSLLQHSTPVQIRFFMSVLQHMAQSDPMTALLSPNPAQSSLQTQMEAKLASMNLKSPSAGGASGFPGSPTVNQFLAPEAASTSTGANQSKLRQNRISAPGTLQPSDRWQGQLDQVIERGPSPGVESNTSSRSRSPAPEPRPKSTDFAGKSRESDTGFARSPRLSGGLGLGLGQTEASSPASSPYLNNASWASMSNTPLVPMFTDPKIDVGMSSALNMANLQLAAAVGNPTSRVALDDVRQYRRAGATSGATGRNVSGQYNDDGELVNSQAYQPGRSASPLTSSPFNGQSWSRSPVMDQFGLGGLGLGDTNALAGLGMNFSNNLNPLVNPNAAQMLALAQAQQQQLATAASFAQAGYGGQPGSQLNLPRASGRPSTGRRSPLLGKSHSPSPAGDRGAAAGGGGAGGGAGVAGPDDIDLKILEDVSSWLRVLRLHKYTANFEKSNWKQMALMTDADLQDNGVNAQGARTKFLKVFYNVRIKFDIPHPEGQEEYAPGATKEGDK